jgi:hypothetical protein
MGRLLARCRAFVVGAAHLQKRLFDHVVNAQFELYANGLLRAL